MGVERHLYTLRQHVARVLPADAQPLRILHISDLHLAPWQKRRQRWVAQLADLKPDFVINTGDNLGHEDGLSAVRRALLPFAGVPGVFVHGSNDVVAPAPRNPFLYFTGPSKSRGSVALLDTPAMDDFFTRDLGWQNLNNNAASFDLRGLQTVAFGVDDPHREWDRLDLTDAALGRELLGREPFRIAVAHAPYRRILDAFNAMGSDITFAGHTHGGQVCLPFFGALVANCDIPLKQAKGFSSWTAQGRTVPLNVSAGVGHSIYAPVRFACRPEATLLTLLPRKDK